MRRSKVLLFIAVVALALGAYSVGRFELPSKMLIIGRQITPLGDQTEVGSFPANMILSPDGKYVIVTNTGFRQQLSVLDSTTGKLASRLEFSGSENGKRKSLYFGLDARQMPDGSTEIAVSRGGQDIVSLYRLASNGVLTADKDLALPPATNPLRLPRHVAGVVWSLDGKAIYAVTNQSHAFNGFKGSILKLDALTGNLLAQTPVGAFPLAALSAPNGDLYVSNEGGREVTRVDAASGATESVATGDGPANLAIDRSGKTLFVSNTNSDTVSVIDLATHKVRKTILLRPERLRRLPGATPLGMALSQDNKTLFVAMGDLYAVAVVDLASGQVKGYLPAGWYPTSVVVSGDGSRLFVSNAKGVQESNPNSVNVRTWGKYAPNILEGTVSMIDLSSAMARLKESTLQVLANNRLDIDPVAQEQRGFVNPGIDHIFYIVKENRTYDQVLGDIAKGNGDPSLTLFGRDVTPNQHALAERFALFDNFYVCAEVSADGWNWSTSGMTNAYTARNVPYNYSGRGRSYDFEGTNNDSAPSLEGRRDAAEAPGGYIWDAFLKNGLTIRNYGMFDSDSRGDKGPDGRPLTQDNQPDKPALVGRTCTDYRIFDMSFADSDAWVKLNLSPTARQKAAYGRFKDPSRFTTWRREFDAYVKGGNLPTLTLIRLPRNHTSGTAPGLPTAKAMVADNDYGVGEIVDAISHSPYWKRSAIFVIEDDAQSGFDHVDCHRSPVLVISPYIAQGTVSSSFYNTDSVLRTIELLCKVPPNNEYVATARAMNIFGPTASNLAPYSAQMADAKILSAINSEDSYRAKDSLEMFNGADHEESAEDLELNEILWRSIRGAHAPLPDTPGVLWSARR